MSLSDLDDILGLRPTKRARASEPEEKVSFKTEDVHQVTAGVSIPWLVKAFRMSRAKVEAALKDCPASGTHRNGGAYYDLPTAAAYLVTPKNNGAPRKIEAKDLPLKLRDEYWSAKTRELKYRVLAGDLWPTASVLEVLGEAFKTIKMTTQLWTDTVEEQEGLTIPQRNLLVELADRLLDDMHQKLVEQAKSSATESFVKDLDNETEEA
jgi:hypothetical protein